MAKLSNINKLISAALVVILIISANACKPSSAKLAKQRYNSAVKLVEANKYNLAKLTLDTIIETQQKQIEYYTKAKDLLWRINIEEQKNSILFLDSMLASKQSELEPLMKNFSSEETEGLPTQLVHNRQKTSNSYNRTFIKPNLDLEGNFYLSSHYCGGSRIYHTHIKVYFDGQAVTTEIIDADSFYNRNYRDEVNVWEVIQYKDGKDNGVVDFIAQNADKLLKAQFIGKQSHYIVMETFDKEAIRDSYEISFILKEIARIKQEKEKAKKELKRLQ